MSGGHAFKGGGGGKGHAMAARATVSIMPHGGNWDGHYNSHHHGKYGHYRRYGYPWYGVYAYGGGGCGWLYSRALATGSDYWWSRYYQCTGDYY